MAASPLFAVRDSPGVPLCVDLDGTLIRTDLLWEATALLLKQKPWLLMMLPFWLLLGRARLKEELASRVDIRPASLPYQREFLSYLSGLEGRDLVLVTASPTRWADAIANYLGIFTAVYATGAGRNLKGSNKRQLLNTVFGQNNYDYAGDSRADLAVWEGARQAILVNVSSSVRAKAHKIIDVAEDFPRPAFSLRPIVKALRIHQWSKNVLILIPAGLAHKAFTPLAMAQLCAGFVTFGLVASAFYILNDLMDLVHDRQHPTKQKRPWASGALPLPLAFALMPALLCTAVGLLHWLPQSFGILVLVYALLTTTYSLYLKRMLCFDILSLAFLYTLRILAGGHLAGVPLSPWLLGFSVFFFSSLALAKRTSELFNLKTGAVSGRSYFAADLPAIAMMGVSSGYVSALILALYMNSADVMRLYQRPQMLWLICPLVMYWLSRLWIIAWRGQLNEDPIVFAIRDRVSYLAGAAGVALILGAL